MKLTRRLSALTLFAALLLSPIALADSITFNGTVIASQIHEVYAAIGGKVDTVDAEVGAKLNAGDTLATLSTTKVYAEEAGTVTGVFGQPGDSAETVSQRYGSVVSIEGESVYSVSASTENAYNSTDTRFIHVGEAVYLSCYSDGKHTGTGVVTAIEGTDYTVKVLTGEFLIGETVNVYRGNSTASTSRIGRGTLNRANPTAVSGTGSIVSYAVSAGDQVQRGDLLFETLDGSFDGLYMSGSAITTDVAGTISKLNAEQGDNVQKGDVVAVIYPEGAMRIEAQIEEANLGSIAVGDPVSIELIWNQDDEVTYPGVISMISAVANSSQGDSMDGESAVTYNVYVDFTPDANTRYGMTAVVTTLEAEEDITEAEAAPEEPDGTEEPEGVEKSPVRPEMPEGFEKSEAPEKVTEYGQNQ